MPGNFKKDDLRVEKTIHAIEKAFFKNLEYRNFAQITVNALCEEAQISRRTFYLHFNDKYDLLKFCLTSVSEKVSLRINDSNSYTQVESTINQLLYENRKAITNLIKDANQETLDLWYAFMLSLLNIEEKKDNDGKIDLQYTILSNFCTGGMVKLLTWLAEDKFSPDFQLITAHLISLISHIMTWITDQNPNGGNPLDNEFE